MTPNRFGMTRCIRWPLVQMSIWRPLLSTYFRFENGQTRQAAWAGNLALVEQFVSRHTENTGAVFPRLLRLSLLQTFYGFGVTILLGACLRRRSIDASAILNPLVVRRPAPRTITLLHSME